MIHVFVGPSLAAESVTELLPEANLCPPVRHGDLLRLDPRRGDVVAIIDGLFHHEIAIRHKEILDLLRRGVHVCGASSMGALRAAELHPYGMLGIGAIFAMLASGEIDGDDEVSLVHAPASDGYRPLTEALVDIRFHCRRAVAAGVLTEADGRVITAAASGLPYDERVYARILELARDRGLGAATAEAYSSFVKGEGHSAKRDDALALLHHLQGPAAPDVCEEFELAETHSFHDWRQSLRGWRDASGSFIADRVVLDFVRVVARDYPAFHERVALEELAAFHSVQIGLTVPAAHELIDDFREMTGLRSEVRWRGWLSERLLREEELGESLVRGARLRALAQTSAEPSVEWLRRLAGEYAVAIGLWPADEVPDARLAPWLTGRERDRLSSDEQVARVAVRTFRIEPRTTVDGPFLTELKRSGTFARARAMLVQRPPLSDARPSASAVLDWCAMRWGVHAIEPLDVLDRGLGSVLGYARNRSLTEPLVRRAGGFYSRVRASGDFPFLPLAPSG
jgi:hypothetical protein